MADSCADIFQVRQIKSVEEFKSVIDCGLREGLQPGLHDDEVYYPTDPTGFYIGELNGVGVSYIAVVKYGEAFAHIGYYIVEKPYRGKGYGLKTFKVGLASLSESCNCSLNALEDKVHLYEKSGFKRAWLVNRFKVVASFATRQLSELSTPSTISIQPSSQLKFEDISKYDASIFGIARDAFLKNFLATQDRYHFSAIDEVGGICGIVSVKKLINQEDGWRIGPLFADNALIAKLLIKEVVAAVMSYDPTLKDLTIAFDVLAETNPDASSIVTLLKGELIVNTVQMYSKEIPNIPFKKVYAASSVEIGCP